MKKHPCLDRDIIVRTIVVLCDGRPGRIARLDLERVRHLTAIRRQLGHVFWVTKKDQNHHWLLAHLVRFQVNRLDSLVTSYERAYFRRS